jgi:hypothetical protein
MSKASIFEITDYCLNKKNISFILKENIFKNHQEISNKYTDYNNINKSGNKTINKLGNKTINKLGNKTKNDFFIKEQDKLFWMLYIFENGYDNYIMLGKNTYVFEMKYKTKLIKKIKENKKDLKHFKIKISDIEADLLYSKKINITTLFILLTLKNINFLYYTENLIYQWKKKGNEKMFILKHNILDNIYINEDKALTDEYFESLKQSRLLVDSLKKPIRGLSYYKVGDLKEMCKILKINIMKNAKKTFSKKELYEKIIQKIF